MLVGPSGCGKTTTLKMINRLIEPTRGRPRGRRRRDPRSVPVHELRRGIGYVIQQIGLFPHRTIAENIATVPKLLGWDKARITQRVDELVELVGLDPEHLERATPRSSRAASSSGSAWPGPWPPTRPVLLMDEPFGAVDPIVRARLQDELLALQPSVQQDDRARHPRHRRGHQARRPGRHPQRGRRAGAVRPARGAAAGPGQRLRRRVPRPGAGAQAPRPAARSATPSWCRARSCRPSAMAEEARRVDGRERRRLGRGRRP